MTNTIKILVISFSLIGCAVVAGDKPGAIVLKNLDGEHLGFTLFHPDFLEFQWSRNNGLVTVSREGSSYLAYQSDGKLINLKTGKIIGSWKTTKN